jgi:GH15 family glucan-1,4-alpha-glucosidase
MARPSASVADDLYSPIEDYALIGDGLTAALVSRHGSIDWACFPRFDSPSVFARILDARIGGCWRIAPATAATARRRYLPDTNVLVTTFATAAGEADLIDFMPPPSCGPERLCDSAIVRVLRGQRGTVPFEMYFEPHFDYARVRPRWTVQEGRGARASTEKEALTLYTRVPLAAKETHAEGQVVVRAGEEVPFLLTYRSPAPVLWLSHVLESVPRLLEETSTHWRRWIGRCTYRGPYGEAVRRSALALKLLEYTPTSAIVAAPTTSLPEEIGGARNWDYRYSWLRDTAFTLYALYLLGYREDGERFLTWIMDVVHGEPSALQVLYGVGGERWLEEHELPHLEGYRGSRPVRIGNAAFNQRQLDIYGEILDCAFLLHKYGGTISNDLWAFLSAVVDHVCQVWTEPDQGIWEVRSGPQHFVYSKALCWVALDRGIKLATRCGLPADLARWEAARAAVLDALLTRGYDERLGAFTQAFGSAQLDASALAMVLRKVLPAGDPRMRSTVDRVARELGVGGLLRRYLPIVDDGLPGAEGVFLLCSFWLVDCYAEMDRMEEARALFERLLAYANDVGLYAEELDPRTGHHLGNFPQGFTHVALINAATNLAKAEARRSSAGR